MSEAFSRFFIENGEKKSSENFEECLLKEGKSIYEVIRIIDGVPLFLEQHLERLKNSAALIGQRVLLGDMEIRNKIVQLSEMNDVTEGNVKIVFNYRDKENRSLFYFIRHSYPSREQYDMGVDTILFHGERTNPNAKVINVSFRECVERQIKEKNAYEAILVDNLGFITEGSKSNIFIIKGNGVITAPLEAVLPGITRGILLTILKEQNIQVLEEQFHYKDLRSADALFITGTSPKVLPIKRVEAMDFNSSNNTVVKLIMKSYDEKIKDYIRNCKSR
jgi:branched-chain amino acid aminotransferase